MTNRIPELRAAQGWSQAQLAELLAITRQTVIAIEQSVLLGAHTTRCS